MPSTSASAPNTPPCAALRRVRAARRRGSLLPDPRYDVVRCIALAAANDVEDVAGGRFTARALLYDLPGAPPSRLGLPDVQARRPPGPPAPPARPARQCWRRETTTWHVLGCPAGGRGGARLWRRAGRAQAAAWPASSGVGSQPRAPGARARR